MQLYTIATYQATAAAFGGVRPDKFQDFLKMLDGKKKNPMKVLSDLKKSGIPVEENG